MYWVYESRRNERARVHHESCSHFKNRRRYQGWTGPSRSRTEARRKMRETGYRDTGDCRSCSKSEPRDRDAEASEFYAYVLILNDGSFREGQTRELRERMMEHRAGTVKDTAGRNPKLVWFTTVSTRDEAIALEKELKELCDRNPREIRRRVRRFRDLVEELDFG